MVIKMGMVARGLIREKKEVKVKIPNVISSPNGSGFKLNAVNSCKYTTCPENHGIALMVFTCLVLST
jgi:hypothetical protein